MSSLTPLYYLRLGGYAVAIATLSLLLLFLTSTPLDPLIQSITIAFYAAAVVAMAGILRSHFKTRPRDDTADRQRLPGQPEHHRTGTPSADASPARSRLPAHTSPAADKAEASIVLLTRHDHVAQDIGERLAGWNLGLDIVHSCAEASQQLLNRLPADGSGSRVTLIVDCHDLEIDPVYLPALIQVEKTQGHVKLVCITDDAETARSQQLLDAGYTALLHTPIDKAQLFTAITSGVDPSLSHANVVNLARFRQRSGMQRKKHILLADHHTADRKRIAALLKSAGHLVRSVENGEQALNALERQRFDVALINLRLPIMNGTQVIKLHRFTTPHPQWTSFIVMTDQTTPATLRLCRDLQVLACLFKPVPTGSLLELISTAPVVAPSIPSATRPLGDVDRPEPTTQFLHSDLLDVKVLRTLDRLDGERDFIPDLIAIFKRDSLSVLAGMEDAVTCGRTERFLELTHILMDNAGQLGAFALYEMCLSLNQVSRAELEASLSGKLAQLRDLVERTTRAFLSYLDERKKQLSDQS